MALGDVPVKNTHYELLMNIADSNLTILGNTYKREKGIPFASVALANGKKIREDKKYSLMRFMSLGNRWRDDGTFFILMEVKLVISECINMLQFKNKQYKFVDNSTPDFVFT